jgi:hypothetical protein
MGTGLVVLVVNPGARIDAKVESLVRRNEERDRLRHLQVGDFLDIHFEHACSTFGDTGAS